MNKTLAALTLALFSAPAFAQDPMGEAQSGAELAQISARLTGMGFRPMTVRQYPDSAFYRLDVGDGCRLDGDAIRAIPYGENRCVSVVVELPSEPRLVLVYAFGDRIDMRAEMRHLNRLSGRIDRSGCSPVNNSMNDVTRADFLNPEAYGGYSSLEGYLDAFRMEYGAAPYGMTATGQDRLGVCR